MQIFHPAAPVSSREISPDQQTQHIHCLQRVRVFTSLSILFTASLCIYFHSALTALKKIPTIVVSFAFGPYFPPPPPPICTHASTPHPSLTHPPTHTHGNAAVHVLIQREMAFCLWCSPSQKVTQAYPCRIKPRPLL